MGAKMGRGMLRVKTGKLPAGNFQDYSMKSIKSESYPQGVLSFLKHCVIDLDAFYRCFCLRDSLCAHT
jgi:hypothetical protein